MGSFSKLTKFPKGVPSSNKTVADSEDSPSSWRDLVAPPIVQKIFPLTFHPYPSQNFPSARVMMNISLNGDGILSVANYSRL